MTNYELMEDMLKYDMDFVGCLFPMNMTRFYNKIWNNWRKHNKIPMNDAISLWDYIMETDYINNDGCDDLKMKQIIEQIRLFKIECDF